MVAQLDLDLLRCFVAVVETGALSRAAGRIGRSQAAVSMQMARLEDAVGKPLLHRTGRGVSMTVHGERLLHHARVILRAHDDAMSELAGQRLNGHIRFGCPDDYASAFLPPLLSSFADLHPEVAIEVVCGSTPRMIEQLSRHALDLALISAPFGTAAKSLRVESLVWVGLRQMDRLSRPLRLALGDPDALDHTAAIDALAKVGWDFQVAYSSGSLSGLLALARSGQAIAVLTRAAVPSDLRVLPPAFNLPELPSLDLIVAIDEKRASTPARAFQAHVSALLPSL